MFGPLGYELDLFSLSAAEKQAIKEQIIFYKAHRQLLTYGAFYRMTDLSQKNEVVWGVSHQEEALIAYFRILAEANPAAQTVLIQCCQSPNGASNRRFPVICLSNQSNQKGVKR